MAFHDWNNNGKKDIADDFIEYQMYKQSCNRNRSSLCCSGRMESRFHRRQDDIASFFILKFGTEYGKAK